MRPARRVVPIQGSVVPARLDRLRFARAPDASTTWECRRSREVVSTVTLPKMTSLFELGCRDEFLARIERLRPDSARGWGKMDAAQAMAHCALGIEAATGIATLSRPLAARLIGPFFKGWMLGPKPFSKNSPTHPQLVMRSPMEFDRERARLVTSIRAFHDAGPAAAARYEHAFVGRLTGDEWGRMQHKHLDHHLRQFGV